MALGVFGNASNIDLEQTKQSCRTRKVNKLKIIINTDNVNLHVNCFYELVTCVFLL